MCSPCEVLRQSVNDGYEMKKALADRKSDNTNTNKKNNNRNNNVGGHWGPVSGPKNLLGCYVSLTGISIVRRLYVHQVSPVETAS